MSEPVRLNKFLADCGVASRRKCDELIARGHVSVDGRVVSELGARVDPAAQRVEVRGETLDPDRVRPRYYLLNKPAGVICTNDAREARTRAVDLIDDRKKGRIYTVGRLDEDTTGLVLLTNDGDFANRVMHPRYGVAKTYRVRLRGGIDDAALGAAREGVRLAEGRTGGMRAVVVDRNDRSSELLVTLREGLNREVRRVFAKLGYKVHSLHRERIGELTDRGLKIGQWRPLVRAEVERLLHPAPVRGERERIRGRRERTGQVASAQGERVRSSRGTFGGRRQGSWRTRGPKTR
jgi:23S rRNA pseudouridine2605 synthase